MLPVEVVRHYQEIIWHLLDEIQTLQSTVTRLHVQNEELQDRVPPPDIAPDEANVTQPDREDAVL